MSKKAPSQNKSGSTTNIAKNGDVDLSSKIGLSHKIMDLPINLQSKSGMPHDDFHGHDNLPSQNDSYTFTFSTDLSTVQSLSRVHNAATSTTSATTSSNSNTHTLDIANSTFKTTVGLNDKSVQAVLDVVQTSSDSYFASTHIYNDKDGDGQYTETFDIQVATGSTSTDFMQQKFTFNSDGTITANVPANHHNDAPLATQNAVLNQVTLGNVNYVTETRANIDGTSYHFEVFRDDNGDGTWTQIAQGETTSSGVDATTHAIDLVGIQSYLASASAIVS